MRDEGGVEKALLIAAVSQICLYYVDLYDLRIVSDRRELFVRIVQALGAASFILAAFYFWFPTMIIGRGVFMIAAFLVLALVIGWRVAFEWLSRRVAPRERLLLVGTRTAAVALAREMFERRQDLGVEIVGFVDPDPAMVGAPVLNPGVIGTIEDIPSIVRARNVDRVVVSLADARGKLPMDKLLEMKLDGVSFAHLASVYEEYTGKIAVENLRPSWLIFSQGFKKSRTLTRHQAADGYGHRGCRAGDRVADHGFSSPWRSADLAGTGAVSRSAASASTVASSPSASSVRCAQDAEALTGPVWAAKDGDRARHADRPVPAPQRDSTSCRSSGTC